MTFKETSPEWIKFRRSSIKKFYTEEATLRAANKWVDAIGEKDLSVVSTEYGIVYLCWKNWRMNVYDEAYFEERVRNLKDMDEANIISIDYIEEYDEEWYDEYDELQWDSGGHIQIGVIIPSKYYDASDIDQ